MGQHGNDNNKNNHNDRLNKTFAAQKFSERKGLMSHMLARKEDYILEHSLNHQKQG